MSYLLPHVWQLEPLLTPYYIKGMKTMTKGQIMKLTRCNFYIHVADYNLLVKVAKKELREGFKKSRCINFEVDLNQTESTSYPGRIYSSIVILL